MPSPSAAPLQTPTALVLVPAERLDRLETMLRELLDKSRAPLAVHPGQFVKESPLLLSREEAARLAGMSVRTLDNKIAAGEIATVRLGTTTVQRKETYYGSAPIRRGS